MREFVRREIDIVNLRTLLRLWASKATLRYDPFGDGGLEIPKAELAEMISLDVNGLTARLRDYALTEDLAAQIKDLQALGVGSLVRSVEKLHLLEAGRYAHVHPLSVLPILDTSSARTARFRTCASSRGGRRAASPRTSSASCW